MGGGEEGGRGRLRRGDKGGLGTEGKREGKGSEEWEEGRE